MKFLLFIFFAISISISTSAYAQEDESTKSMNQAAEDLRRFTEKTQQEMIKSTQEQAAALNAMQDDSAADSGYVIPTTNAPEFSVKHGEVAAGTQVRITCSTPSATIYYVTGEWQPTVNSRRYTGPITIRRSTTLRAIAVAPDLANSRIMNAAYTVPGSKPRVPRAVEAANGVLRAGTRLDLLTTTKTKSKSVKPGDKLLLSLNQNITIDGKVVIAKGTPVEAATTETVRGGMLSIPGDMTFEVHSLTAQGISIPLNGGETLRGPYHPGLTIGLVLGIPVAGTVAAFAIHGSPATIKPGMPLHAVVTADTPLVPTTTTAEK